MQSLHDSACWTCQLRDVKCDRGSSCCMTCDAVGISCAGYDEKPDWIDDLNQRKRRVNVIKDIVRRHTERKRTKERQTRAKLRSAGIARPALTGSVASSSHNHDASQNLAESPSYPASTLTSSGSSRFSTEEGPDILQSVTLDTSSLDRLERPPQSVTSASQIFCSPVLFWNSGSEDCDDSYDIPKLASPVPSEVQHIIQTGDGSLLASASCKTLSLEQAELFVHYMDYTFWDQHSTYPRSSRSLRGWLHLLLTRSEASLHSTLCLAAYHHSQTVDDHQDDIDRYSSSAIEWYYNTALQTLYQHVDLISIGKGLNSSNSGVDILLSAFQLLSLEVGFIFHISHGHKKLSEMLTDTQPTDVQT